MDSLLCRANLSEACGDGGLATLPADVLLFGPGHDRAGISRLKCVETGEIGTLENIAVFNIAVLYGNSEDRGSAKDGEDSKDAGSPHFEDIWEEVQL